MRRLALLALFALLALASPAQALTLTVPAAIPHDCSSDVTTAVNAWLTTVPDGTSGSPNTAAFGVGVCYRIDGTLQLTDRHDLAIAGNGSTFDGSHEPATDGISQWQLLGGARLTVTNMTTVGADVDGREVDGLQHQHAIDLRGPQTVTVSYVEASNTYGDCVYVGQDYRGATAKTTGALISRLGCVRNGRQGMSVTAGSGIVFDHNYFAGTDLSVFDLEPNPLPGFGADHITISANSADETNVRHGFINALDAPVSDVTVTDNVLRGQGMYMAITPPSGSRYSNFTISGNSSNTALSRPGDAAIDVERVDGLHVHSNTIPVASGQNMAGVSTIQSCGLDVSGNTFSGAGAELRTAGYGC